MITRQLLREWDVCYSDERIAELVPPEGLTLRQVSALDIPADDRMWVMWRHDALPDETWRLLACRWATRALDALPTEQVDPRSRAAIDVAERHALGEATDDELAAAWDAARDAARDAELADIVAARDAQLADIVAASAAASAAAWDAARDAARVAAWDAARVAAWDAAWDAQLADIVAELPEEQGAPALAYAIEHDARPPHALDSGTPTDKHCDDYLDRQERGRK